MGCVSSDGSSSPILDLVDRWSPKNSTSLTSPPSPTSSISTSISTSISPSTSTSSFSDRDSVDEIPRGSPLRYTILEKLQKTIYGGIWKAQDNLTGEIVIAKISRLSSRRPASAESPIREGVVLNSLHKEEKYNEHIIKCLDSYSLIHRGRKCFCLILEYAEGGDLMNKVLQTQAQGLPEQEACLAFRMVAKGLKSLHNQNVCHLDLSPENVLFTQKDQAKITDFGQAELGTCLQGSTTCMKQKIRYRCPEIAKKAIEYDGRKADIWSLGATLWVALTGKFCYEAPQSSDVGFRMISLGREGIKCWLGRSGLTTPSSNLLDLLTQLFQLNPEKRPTIDEVIAHPWCNQKLN